VTTVFGSSAQVTSATNPLNIPHLTNPSNHEQENPCGDYPGDYDAGEEAVKGALELLIDAQRYPLLVVSSAGSHLCTRLIGCLRRLQHWSMTAVLEEVRIFTDGVRNAM
jgi:Tyrosine phosphatase family